MPKNSQGNLEPFVSYTDGTTVASGGTRAAPTVVTDGMDISGATGFRIIVSAASGQTLTAGTVRIWLWSISLGRWVHDATLDYALSMAAATYRDDVSPDFQCFVGYGRVFPQPDGITLSGGVLTAQAEAGVLK